MNEIIIPVLTVGGIGAVLGIILSIADKVFEVQVDPRIAQVKSLLPGYNCGACGYAGCQGMAEALVGGDCNMASRCRPSNAQQREAIVEYLNNAEGPNGEKVQIKV